MNANKTPETFQRADEVAFARVFGARPAWIGVTTLAELVGESERVILHAGPPFGDFTEIPKPVLNSAYTACVYEGWATSLEDAEPLLRSESVRLAAAQDYDVVVPLAGVASPSMTVQIVEDLENPNNRAFSPLNEGTSHALRLGIRDASLIELHRWLNSNFARTLKSGLSTPIELVPIADQALMAGDDCHGRTVAGSCRLAEILAPRFPSNQAGKEARSFVDAAPPFFLNLWMAATKVLLNAGRGIQKSGLVTVAGGNGQTFGIQVSGRPGHWFTTHAEAPKGPLGAESSSDLCCGAIGDSAVVE